MKTVIQTRIDLQVRQEAESILNSKGLSLSAGIRMFLYRVVNERALPFQPRVCKKLKTDSREAAAKIEKEKEKNIAIIRKPIFV